MGTRGAYGFRIDEQDKLTYNHWDSYPEGLGKVIVEFCRNLNKKSLSTLKKKVRALSLVDPDSKPTKAEIKHYNKFADTTVSSGSTDEWYVLLRELQGGKMLPHILNGTLKHMIENNDFIRDSLFCEYAYVIDLDRDVIEFYQGFQHRPDTTNRYGRKATPNGTGTKYYPCKKVGEAPILDIPEDWQKFYKEDDDEQEAV